MTPILQRLLTSAVRAGGFGLAYFTLAELGHALSFAGGGESFATFWPPAGLYLAALVVGRGSWPTCIAAACAANAASDVLVHGMPVAVSLAFCTANTAAACLGAWLLCRFAGPRVTLTQAREVVALVCLPAVLAIGIGATLGAATVTAAFPGAVYLPAWLTWWVSGTLGVLVVAPLIFTWPGAGWWRGARPRVAGEAAALFLGLALVAHCVYGDVFPPPLAVPVFLLPFLLWAAVRFGPPASAAALVVVTLIGLWYVSHGRGPYAALPVPPAEQLLRAQGTLGVTCLSVLLLASVVAERRQAEQARLALIADLERALREIKTLRGLIPLCAWCKKIRDDQGFWQRLEDYLRAHTGARFTHGMCPECLEQQLAGLPDLDRDER